MAEDFTGLGSDIRVIDDLDENGELVTGLDCVAQDLLNGWQQPTGIADGTPEGKLWGVNLASYLNAGLTPDMVFALQVALEVQAERDDRIERCTVRITVSRAGAATIDATCLIQDKPYLFTYSLAAGNIGLLQVQELG